MIDKNKTKEQLIEELAELRKERDRAQQYLDIAEVMLVALNNKGEITLINKKGAAILGYEERELIGQNWFDTCLPTELRESVRDVYQQLMAGEIEPVEFYENSVLTKSGEERIITWHNTVLTDEAGHIISTLSSGQDITKRKKQEAELQKYRDHLEELVDSRTKELALTQDATILCLASLAETRDNETGRHILRTQHYLLALAKHLKKTDKYKGRLDDETIIRWYKSAPLHDVGKVGVPDYILLKPSHLTESEFNTMKDHARLGKEAIQSVTQMLGDNSFLNSAAEIAYTHHEKWDGTGYPRQLKGEDIPLSGRLMAVADVYDALVCKRCYKAPFSHEYAKDYLLQGKGGHFDPDIIDAFLVVEEMFQEIAAKYPD